MTDLADIGYLAEVHDEYIAVICPSGFRMEFITMEQIINTIAACFYNDEFSFTRHNERFIREGDGNIAVLTPDPWINKDFQFKDLIAGSSALGCALLDIVKDEYGRDSSFRLS